MKLDNKKICFIICTDNEQQLEECIMYLQLLEIPEGFSTEILTIENAKSMTAGYNEGMRATDAKYKVYMHQDTFIVERKFIERMIKIFRNDKQIGLIGLVGAEILSKDGVMWHEQRCGNFYRMEEIKANSTDNTILIKRGIKEVEVVDGFLMATQYDIPWREDILKGWDFYDVSQCMEFRRAGYKIAVPAQKKNWVIHACGLPSYWHYNENRNLVLREYPEIYENKKYLRILFIHSKQIILMGLPYGLTKLGHTVHVAPFHLEICGDNESELVEETIEEGNYDLVMTYDFVPSVSIACEKSKVKYYAWVYDSPLLELYRKEAMHQYTFISVFDKKQYARLKELNRIPHLFQIPLAAEVDVFGKVNINKRDEKKYAADVAFVGRLYDNRGYDSLFNNSSIELRTEADRIISECNCCWDGQVNLFGKASEQLIQHISAQTEEIWDIYDMDKRYYCESMKLVRRCNEVERVTILNRLAEKHHVVLYTDQVSTKALDKIEIRPWVDYWSQMPKVFYLSKININITSRSIESGIPQRVWDIMAVGGFCLTNYQPELEEYFDIGKDLEVYHNLEELLEKVDYYLSHEEQRIQIAINGYKKVRKEHELGKRLEKALSYVFTEE